MVTDHTERLRSARYQRSGDNRKRTRRTRFLHALMADVAEVISEENTTVVRLSKNPPDIDAIDLSTGVAHVKVTSNVTNPRSTSSSNEFGPTLRTPSFEDVGAPDWTNRRGARWSAKRPNLLGNSRFAKRPTPAGEQCRWRTASFARGVQQAPRCRKTPVRLWIRQSEVTPQPNHRSEER